MTSYTEEEHALADDLQKHASRLTKLALVNDDIKLMNNLETLVTSALAGRTYRQKRVQTPRRREIRAYEKRMGRHEQQRNESIENIDELILLEGINPQVVEKVANIIGNPADRAQNSRLQLAHQMIKSYPDSGKYVKIFMAAVTKIKDRLAIKENKISSLTGMKKFLLEEEEKEERKGTSAPSKDRDTGEILYHLDMATRHLDVLVDYTLIAGHEDEILTISSAIQKLAQNLRAELEAQRTPLDER